MSTVVPTVETNGASFTNQSDDSNGEAIHWQRVAGAHHEPEDTPAPLAAGRAATRWISAILAEREL